MIQNVRKIVVVNPKGGSGKTTIATNLASYFALQGARPTLVDYDPQGSSMHWLDSRDASLPNIHGIAAFQQNMRVTRSFQLRIPDDCRCVIVDSPAGFTPAQMRDITRGAHKVLMPVLPSRFDTHAASRSIADLLLVAKLDRGKRQLGIVANRTRQNTRYFETLMRFLTSLDIPVATVLRDTQAYVRASEAGLGLFDLKSHERIKERPAWTQLIDFLNTESAATAIA
ncbi:MAG: AAA family ATPase [Pseudomonadota bacterium]